jgi:hypothetical protein
LGLKTNHLATLLSVRVSANFVLCITIWGAGKVRILFSTGTMVTAVINFRCLPINKSGDALHQGTPDHKNYPSNSRKLLK